MITYIVFNTFVEEICLFDIFVVTFFSIFVIPIDLVLLPLELISFVIYKILKFFKK